MKLSKNELIELCEIAIVAAENSGKYISEYNIKKLSVENKKDKLSDESGIKVGESLASQVVTEVDLKSQEIILKELLPTCKRFDLALLTEESVDDLSRFQKEYFWCIDPLDGTLPFVESSNGYSISISLVSRKGEPLIGVVFDPVEKTLYHAVKGEGVFRNKKPWKISTSTDESDCIFSFISDRSFLKNKYYNESITELKILAQKLGCKEFEEINYGGAVMNACWALENAPACYFKFPKPETGGGSLWDYSATACIYNEIGAKVSDIFGNALDLNRHDSTFMNHRGILYATDSYIAKVIRNLYDNLLEQNIDNKQQKNY